MIVEYSRTRFIVQVTVSSTYGPAFTATQALVVVCIFLSLCFYLFGFIFLYFLCVFLYDFIILLSLFTSLIYPSLNTFSHSLYLTLLSYLIPFVSLSFLLFSFLFFSFSLFFPSFLSFFLFFPSLLYLFIYFLSLSFSLIDPTPTQQCPLQHRRWCGRHPLRRHKTPHHVAHTQLPRRLLHTAHCTRATIGISCAD